MVLPLVLVAALWTKIASAFISSSLPSSFFFSPPPSSMCSTAPTMLLSGFPPFSTATGSKKGLAQIKQLKKNLFDSLEGSDKGRVDKDGSKQRTINAILALAEANPTPNSATSGLASGTWDLVWTTEDEIHLFRKKGLLGCACRAVLQTTEQSERRLENIIEFDQDSALRIVSKLTPEAIGPRVYFTWEDARVIYKGFSLPFPSFFFVRNAYYDNVYLDKELRCVKDIRGNYLVVRRV